MTEAAYFDLIKGNATFSRQDLMQSFRAGGYELSDAAFFKKLESMVREGEIIRVGRNLYSLGGGGLRSYCHEYSDLSNEVSGLISGRFPLLDFSILELTQLNRFVNHQVASNVIFLSVEAEIMDFVFESLKDKYFGKVLIRPTMEMFYKYWSEGMIVVIKLTTEAPKDPVVHWHTRLEKLLVDIMAEPLLKGSFSESELPGIYEDAFSMYAVDESCLFRYARRRNAEEKIRALIRNQTNIVLKTGR